ncbi:MAG: hypothetical protein WCR74_05880 [Betaproteobacteria bacterium]
MNPVTKVVPFPPGTKFVEVEDMPLAILPDGKVVLPDGRPYPVPARATAWGSPCSKEEFDALAAALRPSP